MLTDGQTDGRTGGRRMARHRISSADYVSSGANKNTNDWVFIWCIYSIKRKLEGLIHEMVLLDAPRIVWGTIQYKYLILSFMKVRWYHDCLSYIMGISIHAMSVFILDHSPGVRWHTFAITVLLLKRLLMYPVFSALAFLSQIRCAKGTVFTFLTIADIIKQAAV